MSVIGSNTHFRASCECIFKVKRSMLLCVLLRKDHPLKWQFKKHVEQQSDIKSVNWFLAWLCLKQGTSIQSDPINCRPVLRAVAPVGTQSTGYSEKCLQRAPILLRANARYSTDKIRKACIHKSCHFNMYFASDEEKVCKSPVLCSIIMR